MIYLDNAATSYPKPAEVYDEISRCMREYCANPGRGGHKMSISSAKAVWDCREKLCSLFNIKNPLQLCFTKNATEALNIAIRGVLKQNDHVITTRMEHNSVIRPLKTLEKEKNIEISFIEGNAGGEITPEDAKKLIRHNTRLIVCTISSNVNGIVMPIREIGLIARKHGIFFLVDGSQGAGTIEIDVDKMNIDLLAFPGHKSLLGPQGTGGLYVTEDIDIEPLIQGGTGSSSKSVNQPVVMPDLLESGTLNTPGIAGLAKGIEFIQKTGQEKLAVYKNSLVKMLHEGIREIKGMKLYSVDLIENNTGITALNYRDIDSEEISEILDKQYNIATRAGIHCAPYAHSTLGTLDRGIVRLSVGCFNTPEEIEYTLHALRNITTRQKKVM